MRNIRARPKRFWIALAITVLLLGTPPIFIELVVEALRQCGAWGGSGWGTGPCDWLDWAPIAAYILMGMGVVALVVGMVVRKSDRLLGSGILVGLAVGTVGGFFSCMNIGGMVP